MYKNYLFKVLINRDKFKENQKERKKKRKKYYNKLNMINKKENLLKKKMRKLINFSLELK